MANFMINDLSNGSILNNDNFLKSDSNGVLSKVAFSDIKNALFTNGIVGSNISIPFYTDNSIFTNDISTNVEKSIFSGNFNFKDGRVLIFMTAGFNLSKFTGSLKIFIDDNQMGELKTNIEGKSAVSNLIFPTVTAGMHKVELKLFPQSSDVTLTLLQFTTFKVIGFQF